MSTHRLTTASSVSVVLSTYMLIVWFWIVTIAGLLDGNERVKPLLFILPPCTLFIWWWASGFKQVALDGDVLIVRHGYTLIVRNSKKVAMIPVSQIKRVSERPMGRGYAHVVVVFKESTEVGRLVRISTYYSECEHVANVLRHVMKTKSKN